MIVGSLQFEEKTHTYRYGGQVVPSVTQLIGQIQDWAKIKKKIGEEKLEAKARLGVAVHKACELFANDDLDEEFIHPSVQPYLSAFKQFIIDCEPNVLHTETQLYHDILQYAGTFDLVAHINNERWIIDIKSTAQHNKVTGIQLSAYEKLAIHNGLGAGFRLAALQLKPNGKYDWKTYDSPRNWRAFTGLIEIFHWRKEHGV